MLREKTSSSFLLILYILCISFISCKKEKNNEPVTVPLNFTGLVADNDTIQPGTSTAITATATGEGLTYTWTATAGNIVGSGNKITYASTPCMDGNYNIQCEVKDKAGSSQSKSVTIRVVW
ncbi:MAG: PKD domain-containing protein [Bacteroidia bacterium]|nr:PKD domain-containing protein [Bacteroidia bacterium]